MLRLVRKVGETPAAFRISRATLPRRVPGRGRAFWFDGRAPHNKGVVLVSVVRWHSDGRGRLAAVSIEVEEMRRQV
jgi:hypothetical protein